MAEQIKKALASKGERERSRVYLRFLKLYEVCERIGYKKSWVWDSIRQKRFPKPIYIGSSPRWLSEEIESWQREVIERSRTEAEAR